MPLTSIIAWRCGQVASFALSFYKLHLLIGVGMILCKPCHSPFPFSLCCLFEYFCLQQIREKLCLTFDTEWSYDLGYLHLLEVSECNDLP